MADPTAQKGRGAKNGLQSPFCFSGAFGDEPPSSRAGLEFRCQGFVGPAIRRLLEPLAADSRLRIKHGRPEGRPYQKAGRA